MNAILTERVGHAVHASAIDQSDVVVSWSQGLSDEENHRGAARKLCRVMGWSGRLVEGRSKTGRVYCLASSETTFDIEASDDTKGK